MNRVEVEDDSNVKEHSVVFDVTQYLSSEEPPKFDELRLKDLESAIESELEWLRVIPFSPLARLIASVQDRGTFEFLSQI